MLFYDAGWQLCNHPALVADLEAGAECEGLEESGKIVLLAQLLPRLRTAGRRVLLLSQSIKMLGILQAS